MIGEKNLKHYFKSVGIFGSMHLVTMLSGLLRSKLIAHFSGTQGVGFYGFIFSAFQMIIGLVQFGLPNSFLKYFSADNELTLGKRIIISKKLNAVIGALGSILMFLFANNIATVTFGNIQFSWAFQLLSIALFLKQISMFYSTFLQSQSKIEVYAKSNFIANLLGLIIAIPILYFFKLNGILYQIVIVTLIESLAFYLGYKVVKIQKEKVDIAFVKPQAQLILKDGFAFGIGNFTTLLAIYVVQWYINQHTNLDVLGEYIAGFTILNTYVAILFTVMGMDYFPRLSKLNLNAQKLNEEVNNQLYIGILLLTPILLLVLLLAPFIVKILYNSSFTLSISYIQLATLGIYFKLFSWAIGFVLLAKGNQKLVVFNALIFNVLFVIFHIAGFYFGQIKGIAIASSLYYFCHLCGNYLFVKRIYPIKIDHKNLKLYSIFSFLFMGIHLLYIFQCNILIINIIAAFLFILISLFSMRKIIPILFDKN